MPEIQVKLRSAYKPHRRILAVPVGPTLAKQSFKDECDINTILAKYKKTGVLDHFNTHKGDYKDLGGSADFHQAMNIVIAAQASFATLPAEMRFKFKNDPAQFLAFVSDEANAEEMIAMGLRTSTGPAEDPSPTPDPPEPKKGSEEPASEPE